MHHFDGHDRFAQIDQDEIWASAALKRKFAADELVFGQSCLVWCAAAGAGCRDATRVIAAEQCGELVTGGPVKRRLTMRTRGVMCKMGAGSA